MKLRWSERAIDDLADIHDFIAGSHPKNAGQWLAKLRRCARDASQSPMLGRKLPELARNDIREALLGRYRIVYRVDADGITVPTVFEGHRLLKLGD